jgi:methyl-accepting chemotaxis protein
MHRKAARAARAARASRATDKKEEILMAALHMNTRTRLVAGFGLLIALLIALTVFAMTRIEYLGQSVDGLASVRVPKLISAGKSIETLLQTSRQMRNVLILDDEAQIRSEIADIQRNSDVLAQYLDDLGKTIAGETETNLFKAINEARSAYAPHEQTFLKHAQRGDYSTARDVMLAEVRNAQGKYIDAISMLIEYGSAESQSDAKGALATRDSARTMMMGFSLLAIVLGTLAAVLITRELMARLGGEPAYAAEVASAIAAGDLASTVSVRAGDDSSLLANMKRMREDLARSVGGIRSAAESVRGASKEIAAGNTELSRRTEEQASSLEETSSSMEELTSAVKQNTESARQASELAANASSVATNGGKMMADLVQTMSAISASSKKVADIIGVIDGIAFQTNILALNAAVEAARAGDAGRGFAVVASEVRTLAQRSASAAKEIKDLIHSSVERVGSGATLVEDAGRTMQDIVASAKRVTETVAEIAAASQEQLSGIEQVGSAVQQMDQLVQQNAAIVEQSAAAAENMAALSEELAATVARFKVDAADQRSRAEIPTLAVQAAPAPQAAFDEDATVVASTAPLQRLARYAPRQETLH